MWLLLLVLVLPADDLLQQALLHLILEMLQDLPALSHAFVILLLHLLEHLVGGDELFEFLDLPTKLFVLGFELFESRVAAILRRRF